VRGSVEKYGDWAIVTGGSGGIGLAFAKSLASAGHSLVLVARGRDLLDAHAKEIAEEYKVKVEVIAMDLAKQGACLELYQQTKNISPGLVVLNAGMEMTGSFTKISPKKHRALTELNVQVPAELAQLFGADMVSRGRGGIVFISSLFGYQGVPLVANYAASKAYILTLGEALHVEMRPHGVDVLVVSPGLTETEMTNNMPIDFRKMPITKHQPATVASIGLRALGHKASVVPGLLNKMYAFENRLIPRLWPTRMFGFMLRNAMYKDSRTKLLNTINN